MYYLPKGVWAIIKEFVLDWQKSWHEKLKLSLDCRWLNISNGDIYEKGEIWANRIKVGVRAQYPVKIFRENYNLKNRLYYTYFRVPWRHKSEMRVSNSYNIEENNWTMADCEEGYLL